MSQPDDFATWQMQFAPERLRLLDALGELTAGGIIEGIQPIGATSVPGMLAKPCVDIGLAVWPFPLEARHHATLNFLGYTLVAGYEDAPEQRFRHATGDLQLFLAEPGSDEWTNYLLIRDYLRNTEGARQTFSQFKQSYRAGAPEYEQVKARLFSEMLVAARAWWISTQGFAPVEAVAQELKEFERPWHISSGWAVDLFLGRVTRVHHDVDIVIAYTDQLALQQYLSQRGWKMVTPFEGRLEPWPPHMLLELPRHQVHAHRDGAFIDCLLSDLENGLWHYRRDPAVVRQLDRAVLHTTQGIPFLAPELVLLFKSKNTSNKQERSQDQIDFDAGHTHLEAERRAWLRWALFATEPTHPWIEQLR
jgi:GrpB-like predicted nucleotidyltransferase (UPF0157 family)